MKINKEMFEAILLASIDQLDKMLSDNTKELNELANKEVLQWDRKDLMLARFAIHAAAARATYLKETIENG